ncbi:MAG: nitroreductase family deazaflavin-dependent oxidoreductase [Anaerolineae bacterium]|nr:nitroreductase family deazaflavin-dependent oxidoreductase [Anaerolineae bacterium]
MSPTMRKILNPIMRWLLHTPLHFLISGWCMLITVRGRKSGRLYTTPVYYRRSGDRIRFLSGRTMKWVRNLEGGAPVSLRLRGRDLNGTASLIEAGPVLDDELRNFYPRMKPEQVAELVLVEVMV